MRRIERAKLIRDVVLAYSHDQWTWIIVSGARFRELRQPEWFASLSTPFTPLPYDPNAKTFERAVLLQRIKPPLDYLLDVWTVDAGKVLSLVWNDDETILRSMRRGDWEANLFGLPPYIPNSRL